MHPGTSDSARLTCGLRFNGESYGWEAQFLERGELWSSRGAFALRELAVQWATVERTDLEQPLSRSLVSNPERL